MEMIEIATIWIVIVIVPIFLVVWMPRLRKKEKEEVSVLKETCAKLGKKVKQLEGDILELDNLLMKVVNGLEGKGKND